MKSGLLFPRGFTLVELLVVMSIMSFLASVVLTSVGAARAKGADSSIKQTLNNTRAQAQLVANNTGSFATSCTDSVIQNAVIEVNKLSGGSAVCVSDSLKWALASPLKSGGVWCVDSSNVGRSKTSAGSTYTSVNSTGITALNGIACR